jgi:hypothetical protein
LGKNRKIKKSGRVFFLKIVSTPQISLKMNKLYFFLVATLLLFSCQSEENTINQGPDSALTKSSPLSMLLSRVSQNPTHCDNILDDSNCYSIKLPVSLTVNGETFTVNDESDFDDIQENIDDSDWDDDTIQFSFPIAIVFRDFQEMVVNSQQQLEDVDCGNDGNDFNEIRCIDVVYPVSINIYDTNNQIANTIVIYDDNALYHFIENVPDSEIFTIVYPITLTLSDATNISVNSNEELEVAVEEAIDDCDHDQGGSGSEPETLEDIIVDGTWHISYCEGEQVDYTGFNFTFLANGIVTAVKNGVTTSGTWNLYDDGSHEKMALNFNNSDLHELNEDWKVTEYNATNFRLKDDHGDSGRSGGHNDSEDSGGGHDYVYFTKN